MLNSSNNNKPLRILMLFTIMNRGGAESMVMNYFRHIDRTKVVFDFMVHREERGAYDDEIEALGGHIFRMIPFHPFTFSRYKTLISAFFDEHPDYRIIHGHCSELGYFVYKEASRRGIPVIIAHAHNAHALYDAKWIFRTWFKYRMRKYITQPFTCGEESAKWLFGKTLAQKAILQRNAIDTSECQYNESIREKVRKEFSLSAETLLIGHVGRFNRQKNHDFLIDIFREVVNISEDSKLLLVGKGELEQTIREKVTALGLTEKVIFAGIRSDVPELLQAMDVFLFPSFMEGLSLSMMEAQSSGLSCIVSNTIPEEVAKTDLVRFLPLSNTAEEWANVVMSTERKDRSVYANMVMEAGYDIKENALWLQNLYESLYSDSE